MASTFNAGDDAAAKAVAARLAAELDFDIVTPVPCCARWLEPLAMLWIHLAYKQVFGPTGHAFKLLRRQPGVR
jgi:predicted dinucleotide-binding enzyme